jgi:NAD(P)-dependent dehydrogenase (short-subunit alcohol dehydrogenase family)
MSGEAIRDKVAVVTGSTKGIGLAAAEALLASGAKVVVSARDQGEVAAVGKRLLAAHPARVAAHACDVRLEAQVDALFRASEAAFGGVDILVNNAGVGLFKNLEEMTLEEWNRVIETNVTGVFLCSRAAIPRMRRRGGGYISTSRPRGEERLSAATAYNASKFEFNAGFVRGLDAAWHDGIRALTSCRGGVSPTLGTSVQLGGMVGAVGRGPGPPRPLRHPSARCRAARVPARISRSEMIRVGAPHRQSKPVIEPSTVEDATQSEVGQRPGRPATAPHDRTRDF